MDKKIIQEICQAIVDKKGENLVVLDVRGVSSMTNYFIICEGGVGRHTAAIAKAVKDVFEKHEMKPLHIEGLQEGDWIVLDYLDIIVHVFTPEMRSYYSIDEVWKKGVLLHIPVNYGKNV